MSTYARLPIGSIVRLLKTGEFARIIGHNCMMDPPDTFLNYYIEIEGRSGMWVTFDDCIELECVPPEALAKIVYYRIESILLSDN